AGEDGIAAHQQAPRAGVIGCRHRIEAVSVTRAWISISPGSTGVCAALSAPRIIVIIGLGGATIPSRESSIRSTRSIARPAPDAAASAQIGRASCRGRGEHLEVVLSETTEDRRR